MKVHTCKSATLTLHQMPCDHKGLPLRDHSPKGVSPQVEARNPAPLKLEASRSNPAP